MKKSFNVNGTTFTVNVDVQAESYYDTIQSDYKKLLYLLGEVSKIGAKLDHEFTTRNPNLQHWEDLKNEGIDTKYLTTPGVVQKGLKPLTLTTREKNTVVQTIDDTMWWFNSLKGTIKNL